MFLQYFVWGSWYVTAGTYFIQELNFTGPQVGLIYGSSALAAMCSPFMMGVLADRYVPVVKLLTVLQLCGGVFLYVLSGITAFYIFYPVMIVYMLIFIPSFSLTNSICFQHLNNTEKEFPKIRVWGTVAWISAGLLVSYLKVEAKSTPLMIASAVSFLLALYSTTLPKTKPPAAKVKSFKQMFWGPEIKTLIGDPGFKTLIVCLALICIPAAYYYTFVNAFLNEMGIESAAGKMSVGQATEIFAMLSLPFLFRYIKLKWIILCGLTFWGIRYLLLSIGSIHNTELFYLLAIAMHGPAYVFAILSAQILIDIKVPNHLRSTAQGFFSLITLGLGAFIGAYFAGATVGWFTLDTTTHDWTKIWLIPGVFGILVAVIFANRFKGISTSSEQ